MHICPLCRKPFLNGQRPSLELHHRLPCGAFRAEQRTEASFNRHVGYCRRARARPHARARSCRACSLAKSKCSFHPQCQRCTRRGIVCSYDNDSLSGIEPLDETCSPPTNTTASLIGAPANDNFDLNGLSSYSAFLHPTDVQDAVDWNTVGDASDDIFIPGDAHQKVPDFANPIAKLMPRPRPVLEDHSNGTQAVEDILANLDQDEFSLMQSPGSRWTYRNEYVAPHFEPQILAKQPESQSLAIIPAIGPNSCFAGTLILQMLRALPEMMLRRDTFPSFVHPHWCLDASDSPLPEPLVNCMGIAQVFASHNPQSKSFLWRAIGTEQTAFREKHNRGKFSREELLAAVQAQTIYIIMRAIDSSKSAQGLNDELLHTYRAFRELCSEPFCQDERLFRSNSWEEWIFAESRRRTVLVWFLIAHTFRAKTAPDARCEAVNGIQTLPLPAPKASWEARTRAAWQSEYELYRFMHRSGLDVLGDLIDAHKQSEQGSDIAKLKMDSWTANSDHLGLMLSIGMALI